LLPQQQQSNRIIKMIHMQLLPPKPLLQNMMGEPPSSDFNTYYVFCSLGVTGGKIIFRGVLKYAERF